MSSPSTSPHTGGRTALWTFLITSFAMFMTALDNLIVTTALPAIRRDLGADLGTLEWTVNGYTLPFAVLLLVGATVGDRFGRRRFFLIGLTVFTLASAAAALATSTGALIAARAIQGAGAALLVPLTLTLLVTAVPAAKRGLALGGWGAINGLAIALGPLIGGAVVEKISWHWIFWINVPIGVVLLALAPLALRESRGAAKSLDLPGVALASLGLFGIVFGLVRGTSQGWTSGQVLTALLGGPVLVLLFLIWERRTPQPMLPMRLFTHRSFSAANLATLLMLAGMFGSIFWLTQLLQNIQGYSPLAAGLRMLPWTGMPMLIAPFASLLSDRWGGRLIIAFGLGCQAVALVWFAVVTAPDLAYTTQLPALILGGVGMAMFFAPTANVVMSAVPTEDQGMASGTNNAVRELGGVLGIAVLSSVFSANGGYATAQRFVDGIVPALGVGAALVAGATLAAFGIAGRKRGQQDAPIRADSAGDKPVPDSIVEDSPSERVLS